MPHKVTLSANYTLPLSRSIGKVTIGGTFVYQSRMRVTTDPFLLQNGSTTLAALPLQYGSEYGVVPGSKIVNLNVNWNDVGGMPIDAAFFVTNVTNQVVYLSANVSPTRGFVSNVIGEPRMFGFRLKYRFGE
jgi:iron complex outermembrane receptor protein